jgi:hypothetical protein
MKIILLLGLALGFFTPASAQNLPNGDYTFSAALGPICLDGRYPIVLGDLPEGTADLATGPNGSVRGTVDLLGSGRIPVTGAIAVRKKTVRLLLKGKSAMGAFSANCVLSGSFFTGTINLRGRKVPAAIDVLGVGPIQADYTLSLISDPKGQITGTGTLTVNRERVPVQVRGTSSTRRVQLTVKGAKTFWQGSGAPPDISGFRVNWSARAFGAATKGTGLPIAQFFNEP